MAEQAADKNLQEDAQSSMSLNAYLSGNTAVSGLQWGDEGKGKIVDLLTEDYDCIIRYNGGANAGHTVVADGNKYAFHLLPCGILYPKCINLLGNGTVINIPSMFDELSQLDANGVDYKGRLKISTRAHLVSQI